MKIILSFILIVLLFSCSQREGESLIVLEKSGQIVFSLDDETSAVNPFLQVIKEEGREQGIFLNNLNNTLYKYDLESGELIGKYPFAIEGPNGIGNSKNFYYHNKDSIFFSSDNPFFIYISNETNNRSFNIKLAFDFDNKNKDNRGSIPHTTGYAPPIYTDGKLNLVRPFVFSPYTHLAPAEYKNINKSNFIFEYDINNNEVVQVDLNFPDEYKELIYSPYFYMISQCFNASKNEIIYSFFLSDSLIIYNKELKTFKSVLAKSESGYPKEYLTPFGSKLPDDINSISWDSFMSSMNYKSVLYDPYNNYYYRFVEYPVPETKRLEHLDSRTKHLGLIVLDDEYNVKGEYSLGYGKYISGMAFVSKQGLNIKNHEKALENESHLVFDIFKF